MNDLNMMMREQARAGLQAQLDAAVTNGDTEAARKVTADIEKLAVQTAPKAPPFNDADIRAQLDKQAWFGTDPKRSAKAIEFGKTMDPKKFPTAEAFATAIVKAVEEEFKPAGRTVPKEDEDNGEDQDPDTGTDAGETETDEDPPARKPRRTDGPGEGDVLNRGPARRSSGPWTKITDAPADIQKEIKRQADKFVSPKAPKEQREKFIANALTSHYAAHQRTKGKK